jgi:hypothetical protein
MCSQKVSPKMFPIWFYPIWFTHVYNSHVYKLKRWAIGSTYFSIWQLGVQRSASICAVPNLPKALVLGQPIWSLPKRKRKSECTHKLINMNHTMSNT